MSLKSVASKLNSSYNSFTPSRSMSVSGALVESLKFNLRFRFSLLGMVASLTKSNSLYNIAQQRYVDRADVDRAKEESSFKSNVINSVSALSRQISLLESVTEKNSAMISMIINDLGYFKRDRKINFLTTNSLSLRNSTAFSVPLSSRTVKGKIDQINTELQELKKSKYGVGTGNKGGEDPNQSKLLKDLAKIAAAGGAAAYLANLAATNAGAGASTTQIATAIGGIIGAASIPATSKIIEYALKATAPILPKIAKVSFLLSIAPTAYDMAGNAIQRTKERFTGKPLTTGFKRTVMPPNPYPPDSVEYSLYETQVETQRKLDDAAATTQTAIDAGGLAILGYYGAKALNKLPIGRAISAARNMVARRGRRAMLAGRESFAERSKKFGRGAIDAYDNKRMRLENLRSSGMARASAGRGFGGGGGFGAVAPPLSPSRGVRGGTFYGDRDIQRRPGRPSVNLGIPPEKMKQLRLEQQRAASAERKASRGSAVLARSQGVFQTVAGLGNKSKGAKRLQSLMTSIKGSSLLRKFPIFAAPVVIAELVLMSGVQEDLDYDRISPEDYKISMTGSLERLTNIVGVGAMGALVGGVVGTFVGGPLGTAAGALLGFGGSLLASVFMEDTGATSYIGEKLFGVIFEDDMLQATARIAASGGSKSGAGLTGDLAQTQAGSGASSVTSGGAGAGAGSSSAVKSVRNNNPGNLKFANQRGSTGKDASGFAIFPTPEAGMVALEKQIRIDMGRGDTLYEFISEYAPAADKNDPLKYTNFVSKATGIQRDEQIPESKIPLLMAAIVQMEGGDSASSYFAGTLNGVAVGAMGGTGTAMASIGAMGGTGTAMASIGNQAADQDILRYFISLGAGTTAQMMPSTDSGGARATAPDSSSEAEGKADAALAAVKGTLQAVTRLAQEVKVLQQKNDLGDSFPQVRPA